MTKDTNYMARDNKNTPYINGMMQQRHSHSQVPGQKINLYSNNSLNHMSDNQDKSFYWQIKQNA